MNFLRVCAVFLLAVIGGVNVAACGSGTAPLNELRFVTDSFVVRVMVESKPTRALEPTYWRVIVNDVHTGKPIQGGQGRVFATNKDRKTVANGLEETGELGTYRTNLMFVTAGMWAMGLQFRADSTKALQRTQDWTQDILSADEPGDFSTPQSARPAEPTVKPLMKTVSPDTARKKVP